MKTLLALCLTILIFASVLAWRLSPSCNEQKKIQLIWATDDNPVRSRQVELFNQTHPWLALQIDPANYYMEKVIVQSVAGIGPDLFDAAGVYVLDRFAESGIALDLSDLAKKHGFDASRTWPGAAKSIMIGDRQYAFPAGVYANVIFYNKALFDRYGVAYPPRDMTWDEFVSIGRKLTRKKPDGRGYECFGAMNIYWYELVLQAGGQLFSPDGLQCRMDSPEALEAIQFYHDLMFKHHIMPTPAEEATISGEGGWGAGGGTRWFGAQRVAMIRTSRWGLITFRQYDSLKGRIGVCHQPYLRRKTALVTARLVAINRNSRHVDEAVKFLEFLTTPEFNSQVARAADFLPPVPAFARTKDFLHDPSYPQETFNDVFVEAIDRGVSPEVSPFVSPLDALQAIMEQLDLVTGGSKTPADACRDMTRSVNGLIFKNLQKYDKYRQRYQQVTGREFDPNDPQWREYR